MEKEYDIIANVLPPVQVQNNVVGGYGYVTSCFVSEYKLKNVQPIP